MRFDSGRNIVGVESVVDNCSCAEVSKGGIRYGRRSSEDSTRRRWIMLSKNIV